MRTRTKWEQWTSSGAGAVMLGAGALGAAASGCETDGAGAGGAGGPGGPGGKADFGGVTASANELDLRAGVCQALAARLEARGLDAETCVANGQFVAQVAYPDPAFGGLMTWAVVQVTLGDERHSFYAERTYDFAKAATGWRIWSLTASREIALRAAARQVVPDGDVQEIDTGDSTVYGYPVAEALVPTGLYAKLEAFVAEHEGIKLRVEKSNRVFQLELDHLDVGTGDVDERDLAPHDPASILGYVTWLAVGGDPRGHLVVLDPGFDVVSYGYRSDEAIVARPDIAEVTRVEPDGDGVAETEGRVQFGPVSADRNVLTYDVCRGLESLGALDGRTLLDCVATVTISVRRTYYAPLAVNSLEGQTRVCDPALPTNLPPVFEQDPAYVPRCAPGKLVDGYDVDATLDGPVFQLEARLARDDEGQVVLHRLAGATAYWDPAYAWKLHAEDEPAVRSLEWTATNPACHLASGFRVSGDVDSCQDPTRAFLHFRRIDDAEIPVADGVALPGRDTLAGELTFGATRGPLPFVFAAFDGDRFVGMAYGARGQVDGAWVDRAGVLFDAVGFNDGTTYRLVAYERASSGDAGDFPVATPFMPRYPW